MRLIGWLAALAALAAAQGGRDTGEGENPVAFLRWKPTAESGAIYNTAWKALEPHFGVLSRQRLFDFDGDPKRAQELMGREAALVVAFDAPSAGRWPERDVPVLRAYGMETDRTRFARWLKVFLPGASRVAVFGKAADLPGYTLVTCTTAAAAEGCDAAWIPEESAVDARTLRRELDAMRIPLVTTSPEVAEGVAALVVRPDPTSLGLDLAAVILGHVRDGTPLRAPTATRLRVTIDLRASRAAGHETPLEALARADVVRREP